uniref:Uncharacterized protein YjbI, contains pentapeptide repeats n=1 Tax=Candidatus Kentrum sp. DK TaxID=2126562 RepID=A0A450S047_9GAMM|nr:MAG: Uncharacterized protein YjbI, contains pentapeptide repeats [Candidatus Kentron sp. DK]
MNNNTSPEASENALTQLLESVNRSAGHLQRVYLQFTLVWTYYIFVVGTTTHQDLLLGKIQKLPLFEVSMDATVAYTLGPMLFWVLHAYLLVQHRLTAPQIHTLRVWPECHPNATHTLRDFLIFPSPFAHLAVGATVSRYANPILTGFALFGMPLLFFALVVYFFLPYHGRNQTGLQLLLLAVDMFLLGFYWPRITAPDGQRRTWWNWNAMKPLLGRKRFVWSRLGMTLLLFTALGISLFGVGLMTPMGDHTWDQIVRFRSLHIESSNAHISKKQGFIEFIRKMQRTDAAFTDTSDTVVAVTTKTASHYALSERDLRHAYLFGMDLRGANLRGADLRHADLRSANLTGAILDGARLDHARLEKAKLDKTSLEYTTLTMANLQEVSAIAAFFQHARFTGAFLGQVDLRGADLFQTKFRGANLTGATLRGAILNQADLIGADLTSAHLQGASLQGAKLTVANLHGAHLNGTSLFGADLRGANLSGASLQGADLRGGRIAGASFEDARIDQADLRGLRPEPLESGRCTALRESLEAIRDQTKPDWRTPIQHAIRRLGTCQGEMVSFDISGLRQEQPHLCDPDTGMAGCLREPVEKYHQRLITEILIPLACADGSAGIAQRLLSRVAAGDFRLSNQRRLACGLIGKGCAARDTLLTNDQTKRQIAGMLFGPEDAIDFLGDRLQDLRFPAVCR